MELMSRAELTGRLGRDPREWTFLGQCYEAGSDNPRACAVTAQPAQVCFTLKPKTGKGRITISAEAIPQFERWNPDLYIRLKAGLNFLQLRTFAVAADRTTAAKRARVMAAQKQYSAARSTIRFYIHQYRAAHEDKRLPAYLQAMRLLLQAPGHFHDDEDSRALELEQKAAEMEQALTNADVLVQLTDPDAAEPAPVPAPILMAGNTSDIPEIEF